MRIRILFCCPRCRSSAFRPSISRRFRDSFLEKIGVHPHRCYACRLRFYLFKPLRLRAFAAALDRPLIAADTPVQQPIAVEAPARSATSIPRYS